MACSGISARLASRVIPGGTAVASDEAVALDDVLAALVALALIEPRPSVLGQHVHAASA